MASADDQNAAITVTEESIDNENYHYATGDASGDSSPADASNRRSEAIDQPADVNDTVLDGGVGYG